MIKILKTYLSLTKPGMVLGNLLPAIAGFILASKGTIDLKLLSLTLAGMALVIASACVFNNYIDRGIDEKMKRTKDRAIPQGLIDGFHALIFATSLAIIGIIILNFYTNLLTVGLALFGEFAYVVLYGIFKRRSVDGTIVGSISGALPPLAGYCAVTNKIDLAGLILFLILVLWQMPHFYSIAIYRLEDYKKAGIPVLPAKLGIFSTKIRIICYIIAFILTLILLKLLGFTGYLYLIVMVGLSLFWLYYGLKGLKTANNQAWARKMFFLSLINLTMLCLTISLDSLLSYGI